MTGIRALLLDVDGTILDTHEFILQATEHSLAAHGYAPVPREKITEAIGLEFDDFYKYILGRADFDPLPLQTAHRTFQLEHLDLSTPFPDTVATLEELARRGYKMAAVTNRRRATLLPTLDKENMIRFFDAMIAVEDAPVLKPSPVPLELAMEHMGVTAAETAMIGDTDIDIQAGKAAGVYTVRARYGIGQDGGTLEADLNLDTGISELLELLPPL